MAYQPQPNTLADRVCAWFLANPEEELSASDIAQKFSVANKSTVTPLLATAVTHRLLAREKDPEDGIYQYKAGPQLHTIRDVGVRPNAPTPATRTPAAPLNETRRCVALPSPAQLVIESGIPIPSVSTAPNKPRYEEMFLRMEVGDSFKCPLEVVDRLRDCANKWGKSRNRKFSQRRLSDTEARIWRIA